MHNQTHQASYTATFYNSAMRKDAEGSPTPVRASPAPVQPKKPKTVSGGRSRPAGRAPGRQSASHHTAKTAESGRTTASNKCYESGG